MQRLSYIVFVPWDNLNVTIQRAYQLLNDAMVSLIVQMIRLMKIIVVGFLIKKYFKIFDFNKILDLV